MKHVGFIYKALEASDIRESPNEHSGKVSRCVVGDYYLICFIYRNWGQLAGQNLFTPLRDSNGENRFVEAGTYTERSTCQDCKIRKKPNEGLYSSVVCILEPGSTVYCTGEEVDDTITGDKYIECIVNGRKRWCLKSSVYFE